MLPTVVMIAALSWHLSFLHVQVFIGYQIVARAAEAKAEVSDDIFGDSTSLLSIAKHAHLEVNKPRRSNVDLEAQPCTSAASELTNIANMVCSEFTKPKIAICIAGAVRTFVRPLLHRTIRTYLVEAVGGDTDVFLYLKTQDMRGDSSKYYGATMKPAEDALLQTAIDFVRPVNYKIENQTMYYAVNPKVRLPNLVSEGNKTHFLQAVLGNLHNCRECWHMILEQEAKMHQRYDFVIRTRPDVSWYLPAQPYCFWSAYISKPGELISHNTIFTTRDWVFFMKRDLAEKYMDGILRHYEACQDCFYNETIAETLIPSLLREQGVMIQEDKRQACMLVRPDEAHFPNNMCEQQFRYDLVNLDPNDRELCAKVTYKNQHNRDEEMQTPR